MLGLSGSLSYAVFVCLCICTFVFVRLAHGNIIFLYYWMKSFQKMYGSYGLKHHTVERLPCGMDERRQTREDKATQPLDAGWRSFAICQKKICQNLIKIIPSGLVYCTGFMKNGSPEVQKSMKS